MDRPQETCLYAFLSIVLKIRELNLEIIITGREQHCFRGN